MQYQAKDLIQLQLELVEAKINKAINHAIRPMTDQINALEQEYRN